MPDVSVGDRKATKTKRVINVRIVVDAPGHVGRYIHHAYDSPEYWEEIQKEYERWINEFHDFLRHHRSQDANIMSVERKVIDCCSVCGDAWEPSEDEGVLCCASCGAAIEE